MRSSSLVLAALALASGCACAARAPALSAPPPRPSERVVVFGDSLVHRSEKDHGLVSGLQAGLARHLPQRPLLLLERGRNGSRIADLAERLPQEVLSESPSAVVLYWDSDCSDVDESGLGPDQVANLRAEYVRQLDAVLERLRQSGAAVLVTGPTLLGERPHGQNPRDAQLDAYAALNRARAAAHGARYLDTRRAFLHWLELHRGRQERGGLLLTEDGEHLNARGTRLATHLLLREVLRWAHESRRAPHEGAPAATRPVGDQGRAGGDP